MISHRASLNQLMKIKFVCDNSLTYFEKAQQLMNQLRLELLRFDFDFDFHFDIDFDWNYDFTFDFDFDYRCQHRFWTSIFISILLQK